MKTTTARAPTSSETEPAPGADHRRHLLRSNTVNVDASLRAHLGNCKARTIDVIAFILDLDDDLARVVAEAAGDREDLRRHAQACEGRAHPTVIALIKTTDARERLSTLSRSAEAAFRMTVPEGCVMVVIIAAGGTTYAIHRIRYLEAADA